jgi:hypothetical protein
MRTHDFVSRRLVLPLMVCLLLSGVLSAEFPELLSLTDNASNDFTIRKADGSERGATLSAGIHESIPLELKEFECGARTHCAPPLVRSQAISPGLFVLHSELRL